MCTLAKDQMFPHAHSKVSDQTPPTCDLISLRLSLYVYSSQGPNVSSCRQQSFWSDSTNVQFDQSSLVTLCVLWPRTKCFLMHTAKFLIRLHQRAIWSVFACHSMCTLAKDQMFSHAYSKVFDQTPPTCNLISLRLSLYVYSSQGPNVSSCIQQSFWSDSTNVQSDQSSLVTLCVL